MKRNNVKASCGKKSGCTLEEYLIPYGKPKSIPGRVVDNTPEQKAVV